ncbi:MAG TPA: hypothetical protein VIO38_15315, partial [Rariglobus sp.]
MKKLILSLCLAASAAGLSAAPVLDERFDYHTVNDLRDQWARVGEQGSMIGLGENRSINDGKPYAVFSNSVQRRKLPRTLGGGWKVSFDVLHTSARRGTWLGLLDAKGQRGYAVMWDSGNSPDGVGNGSVSLRKLELAAPLSDWAEIGVQMGARHDSGHPITRPPFARFELTRDGRTGRITVSV